MSTTATYVATRTTGHETVRDAATDQPIDVVEPVADDGDPDRQWDRVQRQDPERPEQGATSGGAKNAQPNATTATPETAASQRIWWRPMSSVRR